jgi:hypothetical protein
MSPEVILAIITVGVEKGLPALINVLNAWQIEDPTLEDIDKLHELVKKPETYFEPKPPV